MCEDAGRVIETAMPDAPSAETPVKSDAHELDRIIVAAQRRALLVSAEE
jgi:hypothetical protein